MSKNEQLDQLFEKWMSHYAQNGIDSSKFSKDGIIDEEEYENAPKKILFVLRETNDFAGQDLREWLRNGPRENLFHQLCRWAIGILKDFPEFDSVAHNREILNLAMKSVAVINVKKYTGAATADFSLLQGFAFLDKEFIRKEIRIIKPELIISCNSFTELIWALEIEQVKYHLKNSEDLLNHIYEWNEAKIIFWPHHPADRKRHEKSYEELHELFIMLNLIPGSAGS